MLSYVRGIVLISGAAAIFLAAFAGNAQAGKKYRIAVLQGYEAVHNDLAFEGVKAGLEASGIEYELDVRRAYRSEDKYKEILDVWQKDKPDLIYTFGTSTTQRTMEAFKDLPIVFSAVTNPVVTGISRSWKSSGANITGSSNWFGIGKLLKVFKDVVPHLKTLGIVYNPANVIPATEVAEARESLEQLGITLLEVKIKAPAEPDIRPAVESLVGKVDAIWVPNDSLSRIYDRMDDVLAVTIPHKIPVLASLPEPVEHGALVGVTIDYVALGRLSVPLALKILTEGTKPQDLPIVTPLNFRIIINLTAARKIGYEIPLSMLAIADNILE